MIHKYDDTFDSKEIQSLVSNLLLHLVTPQQRAQYQVIFRSLLYASVRKTSLHQAGLALEKAPTGKTIRNQLHELFGECDEAEKKLNKLLRFTLPKRLSKRRRMTVAIDYHQEPFYGKLEGSDKNELTHRNKKKGTHRFFTYASAVLCHKGVRYTLAISRVQKGHSTCVVVKKLMAFMRQANIRPKLLLLDSEFDSSQTMHYLVRKKQRFIIPAQKNGRKASEKGPATGVYRFFGKPKGWYQYT